MSVVDEESKTDKLKIELLKLQENVNLKMTQQLFLRDIMEANYQRMTEECDVYEKELEKIRSENTRYKFAEQCLKNKVIELTGCEFAKSSTGPDKDDATASLQLEVCSNKLLAELKRYRDQVEVASRDLAGAKDQLTKASEREEYLKRCAASLTVLAEADQTKRDREEMELRTMAKRLSAELGDAQCDLGRLRTVVEEMSDVVTGNKPAPITCSGEGLREDNYRLQAELKANLAEETALHARAAKLETALRQCHSRVDAKSRDRQCAGGGVLRDLPSTSLSQPRPQPRDEESKAATSPNLEPDYYETLPLPKHLIKIMKKYGNPCHQDDEFEATTCLPTTAAHS
ncbi:uncharacterized protein LOC113550399 [Rhopalosiphum maidis]|uniref:uncharacterized protein LOC113550399 n=1 Tax=Rhopalosiphum maidis TaxID=43146 RepID=UPI000EFF78DF|nr:uncharacterized protein LOC113550399 [Rhopalosiphum maidis]